MPLRTHRTATCGSICPVAGAIGNSGVPRSCRRLVRSIVVHAGRSTMAVATDLRRAPGIGEQLARGAMHILGGVMWQCAARLAAHLSAACNAGSV